MLILCIVYVVVVVLVSVLLLYKLPLYSLYILYTHSHAYMVAIYRHWFDCLDPETTPTSNTTPITTKKGTGTDIDIDIDIDTVYNGTCDTGTGTETGSETETDPFPSKSTRDIFNLFTHWKMLLIGEQDAG